MPHKHNVFLYKFNFFYQLSLSTVVINMNIVLMQVHYFFTI